jgi:hypothetical protein
MSHTMYSSLQEHYVFLPNNNTVSMLKWYWTNIQSAENNKGFSETIRQLSNITLKGSKNINNDTHFYNWLAGIIDGDGNSIDIRKDSLNRLKLHNRDVRILNNLHLGLIKINLILFI